MTNFPETATTANPVFFRTYSRRKEDESREGLDDVRFRTVGGLAKLGRFTQEETELVNRMFRELKSLPSGRWLWVGGTEWLEKPENFPGAYNCSSTNIVDWRSFGLMMDLAMQGCGTGAVLEPQYIEQLPVIRNQFDLKIEGLPGDADSRDRRKLTSVLESAIEDGCYLATIVVGDSRQGWVEAYQKVLELSSERLPATQINLTVDLSCVRPAGEKLNGFGGAANPAGLQRMFERIVAILNKATGRKLNSVECCLLIDEGANAVVAGNIRRSAGMRQFDSEDKVAATAKDNLWQSDEDGKWSIDPERDALRMANHTRVFHHHPTHEEILEAVTKQFYSGEGAIQYAPETLARANVDILDTSEKKQTFLRAYNASPAIGKLVLIGFSPDESDEEIESRMRRLGLNPCGEILLENNFCNLAEVHLNQIDPFDFKAQEDAFKAAALSACALLRRGFTESRYQRSRELDPIVGVSFTGLFDFFVKAFGVDWLRWWEAGRPAEWGENALWTPFRSKYFSQGNAEVWEYESEYFLCREQDFLKWWKTITHEFVWEYCERHDLKVPNRCTTVQPAGTKSLLTGASPGWHPPKAQRFIRRITFAKNDPVALACIDYGYTIVPSQSDKDENGRLLDDPFDPRCTEWLVEIPVETGWASLPGADQIDISKFSALAQFDFYMQVQNHYTTHNCFSRDTEFLTDEGVRTFESYEPGDSVKVLNKNGDWVESRVVRTSAMTTMFEVLIREGKTAKEKRIKATPCHRFPVRRVSGGDSPVKILTTSQLKPGHRLVLNSADLPDVDDEGVRHGIAFGDGSLYRNNSTQEYVGCQLYLCGAKRLLQSYFKDYERTHERPEIDQTRIYGLPVHYKSLPLKDCSQAYLAGFVAGLLATDGNIHRSTISFSTGRLEVVEFLLDQLPRLGVKTTSWNWYESNSYKDGSGAYQVLVSKATFPENLVIRPHHLEHYQSHESQPCQWRVVSVTQLAEKEYGWCVMEPETNHFTLSDNILVMNTSATIELRESEIEPLADRIHQAIQNDEGYISAALLARFDDLQTFPRLPFEPISKEVYDQMVVEVQSRRKSSDFHELLAKYDQGDIGQTGPMACDSDKCLMPEMK